MRSVVLHRTLFLGILIVAASLAASCTSIGGGVPPAQDTPALAAVATALPAATAGGPAATSAPATVAPSATSTPSPATSIPTTGVNNPSSAAVATTTSAPQTAAVATSAPATAVRPTPTSAPAASPAASAPVCTPGALTPALTEGPYYKTNPPENSALQTPGMSGTRLTISGYVLDANCKPIAGARVDFWQADSAGQYDNQGYTLRGYQTTDAQGRYTVVTVVPGLYPGRTRHIHVKVTPPGGATLTTQLFFPNEAQNASDGIFAAQNVLRIQKGSDGETASFDFVVKTA